VTGHLIWDVKMDFTRKARWVLDGNKTPNPIGSMQHPETAFKLRSRTPP
jgi:hypothetical protein